MSSENIRPTYNAIIVVNGSFDVMLSNAYQTTRLGYCHGFPLVGISAHLVRHGRVCQLAEEMENPIFWLTFDDYNYLSGNALKMIKKHRHIVQVNTWFDGMEELHAKYNAPSPAILQRTLKRILDSEPDFVWCSAPEQYFEFYQGWIDAGLKLVSLPWACDAARYYPMKHIKKFDDVEVAFVGGYREYKEPQYESYLWPHGDKLQTWGYSEWPRGYQGYLDNNDEKYLYQNARLCPTISEPQFAITGDTVERPFKILGCRGLTVFDVNPSYTHLFSPSEVLIPDSLEMHRAMVEAVLKDDDMNAAYREAGYQAVYKRHTYRSRCAKIGLELGL